MAFAGIWEVWRDQADPERRDRADPDRRDRADPDRRDRADPDGRLLRTCAIVTTSANELMRPIHDRMPVVLDPADWAAWLDPATGAGTVEKLMRPAPSEWFEVFPVSSRVNKAANEGPDLLTPLPPPPG
jgi:putative SOS response-associated peptidase YedK